MEFVVNLNQFDQAKRAEVEKVINARVQDPKYSQSGIPLTESEARTFNTYMSECAELERERQHLIEKTKKFAGGIPLNARKKAALSRIEEYELEKAFNETETSIENLKALAALQRQIDASAKDARVIAPAEEWMQEESKSDEASAREESQGPNDSESRSESPLSPLD